MPASRRKMFKALAEKGINILAISTSEIKISVLIDAAYAELAVRTLIRFMASTPTKHGTKTDFRAVRI